MKGVERWSVGSLGRTTRTSRDIGLPVPVRAAAPSPGALVRLRRAIVPWIEGLPARAATPLPARGLVAEPLPDPAPQLLGSVSRVIAPS